MLELDRLPDGRRLVPVSKREPREHVDARESWPRTARRPRVRQRDGERARR